MKKITKKTTFMQIVHEHPELTEVLLEQGMHCIGCPMAAMETVEQGASAHGIDPEKLVEKLNKKLESKQKKTK